MNFASKQVANFCAKYKIIYLFSSSYYPQGNDHAEINKRTILDNLCKSLDKAKGKWTKKLPEVLWAYKQCFKYRISTIDRSAKLYTGYRIPGDISRYGTKYRVSNRTSY